jgi:hypothetical protein
VDVICNFFPPLISIAAWEGNSISDSEDILRILSNHYINCHIHKGLPHMYLSLLKRNHRTRIFTMFQ